MMQGRMGGHPVWQLVHREGIARGQGERGPVWHRRYADVDFWLGAGNIPCVIAS